MRKLLQVYYAQVTAGVCTMHKLLQVYAQVTAGVLCTS